jgi:hypothetical protein
VAVLPQQLSQLHVPKQHLQRRIEHQMLLRMLRQLQVYE